MHTEKTVKNIDTIYHYCSLDTFTKIITNKTIRLSDISKMNDSEEMLHGRKIIIDEIEQLLNDNKKSLEESEKNHFSKQIKMFFDYYNLIFIGCFSSEGDLLSQWRGYADQGGGISIGFKFDNLAKINLINQTAAIGISRVFYTLDEQKRLIRGIFEKEIKDLEQQYSRDCSASKKTFGDLLIEKLPSLLEIWYPNFLLMSQFIKHSSFSEEHEVRIVANIVSSERDLLEKHKSELEGLKESNLNKSNEKHFLELVKLKKHHLNEYRVNDYQLEPIKFLKRNEGLVTYRDLNFERYIEKGIIQEIIIGPKSNVSKEDIQLILFLNGFDLDQVEVKYSQSTLR